MPGTAPINPRIERFVERGVRAASFGNTWQAAPMIDLGELIGRTPHALDRDAVARVLAGKRVLITGAGGSIGAHLAHVAAEFAPEQIVLMERSENALFEIDRQLSRRFPGVSRRAMLHDVVDAQETRRLVMQAGPHIVFHAAAHKHVPLMEDHPGHAVLNNLFGTQSIADASVDAGAERFVMISSDKAVNPSSVMGATKRLAEMYVAHLGRTIGEVAGAGGAEGTGGAEGHSTRMSMVRFGNVLGSACSVLTIWSGQIAEGGPVTVTDSRMTRYFMTIPEAAGLVIASATLDEQPSGGVYVLDMGEPIRVLELAERFVRAHGYEPRVVKATGRGDLAGVGVSFGGECRADESLISLVNTVVKRDEARMGERKPEMDIVFTGVRPGEKIHEELAYAAETLSPSGHEGIRCWTGKSPEEMGMPDECRQDACTTRDESINIALMLQTLRAACETREAERVLDAIRQFVPQFARTKSK